MIFTEEKFFKISPANSMPFLSGRFISKKRRSGELKHFSVEDFIRLHKEKFSTQNLFITVPQAMTYFTDAEESEDPISLKGQTWANTKAFIQKKISDYLK